MRGGAGRGGVLTAKPREGALSDYPPRQTIRFQPQKAQNYAPHTPFAFRPHVR